MYVKRTEKALKVKIENVWVRIQKIISENSQLVAILIAQWFWRLFSIKKEQIQIHLKKTRFNGLKEAAITADQK